MSRRSQTIEDDQESKTVEQKSQPVPPPRSRSKFLLYQILYNGRGVGGRYQSAPLEIDVPFKNGSPDIKNVVKQLWNAVRDFKRSPAGGSWYREISITKGPLSADERVGSISDAFKRKQLKVKRKIDKWYKAALQGNEQDLPTMFDIFTRRQIRELLEQRQKQTVRADPRFILVREYQPVRCEIGGQPSAYNCALELLGQSRNNIMRKMKDEHRALIRDDGYTTLDGVARLARAFKIPVHICDPLGKALLEVPAASSNYKAVYAVATNQHLYPVTASEYHSVRSGKIPRLNKASRYYDTEDLLGRIADDFEDTGHLPSYVKVNRGRITAYTNEKDEVVAAARDYKAYQAVADQLWPKEGLGDKPPTPVEVARKLLSEYDIPRELVTHGPIHRLYTENNLAPMYYHCRCSSCTCHCGGKCQCNIDERDKQIVARDISSCYWNVMRRLDVLLIANPFDRVTRCSGQQSDKHSFYILEGAPLICGFNYNRQILLWDLIEELEYWCSSIWDCVRYKFTPSTRIENTVFPDIAHRLSRVRDDTGATKLVRNTISGLLGQMNIRLTRACLTTDPHIASQHEDSTRVELNERFAYIVRQCDGWMPVAHNRSIYNQIISIGHVHVLQLARKTLEDYPDSHIIKMKVDSVAVTPAERAKDAITYDHIQHFQVDAACVNEPEQDDYGQGQDQDQGAEDFSDMVLSMQQCIDACSDYEPEIGFDFTWHPEPFVRVPFQTANREVSIKWIPHTLKHREETREGCPDHLALLAPARLGKTTFINGLGLDEDKTLFLAPTHKACSHIKKKHVQTTQRVTEHSTNIAKIFTTVVVDEISMVDTYQLSKIMRHCEENNVRMIVSGDYWQLPNVQDGLAVHKSNWFMSFFRRQTLAWHPAAGITQAKYNFVEKFKRGELSRDELIRASGKPNGNEHVVTLAFYNKHVAEYESRQPNKKLWIAPSKLKSYPKGTMFVHHEGKFHEYGTGKAAAVKREELVHCNASTVHKFQGSSTVNPLLPIFLRIDCRRFSLEMMYTALTRTPGFRFELVNVPEEFRSAYKRRGRVTHPIYIYRYNNADGKARYIGQTDNLKLRAAQHLADPKKKYPVAGMKKIRTCHSKWFANQVEAELIKRHNPTDNVKLVPKEEDETRFRSKLYKKTPLAPPRHEIATANATQIIYYYRGAKKRVRVRKGETQEEATARVQRLLDA